MASKDMITASLGIENVESVALTLMAEKWNNSAEFHHRSKITCGRQMSTTRNFRYPNTEGNYIYKIINARLIELSSNLTLFNAIYSRAFSSSLICWG